MALVSLSHGVVPVEQESMGDFLRRNERRRECGSEPAPMPQHLVEEQVRWEAERERQRLEYVLSHVCDICSAPGGDPIEFTGEQIVMCPVCKYAITVKPWEMGVDLDGL